MIPGTRVVRQPATWQRALASAVTDPAELVRLLELDPALVEPARAAARLFPLRVPRSYVARMRKGDARDPLLRQVMPLDLELKPTPTPGFVPDPVGDLRSMVAPGLLHKYAGRVLLTVTGACAVHCRYCFRRYFPYAQSNPTGEHWAEALAYIDADSTIKEVILSGGDPLALSDTRLRELLDSLATIPHLERLRIHTRLPVVLPERVTSDLIGLLSRSRLRSVVVVHVNHPNEIDASVNESCDRLASAGVTLLNQSVLLAGINDDVETLCALSECLFAARILPYYLHQLDRVQGAGHFEVVEERGRALLTAMRTRLPGYLVPRWVVEQIGEPSKTWLA